MSDVDPTAAELHARFCEKMKPGGEIDRMLAGGTPAEKRPAAPDAEIELRKRQIDVQMAEYEHAVIEAAAWHRDWTARTQRGFRGVRRKAQVVLDPVAGEGEV